MRPLLLLAVAFTVAACAAAFPSAPPVGRLVPMPATDASSWIASLRPKAHTTLRFRWTANQENTGRGALGIAPPDSIFLDYRAPLGAHPGMAFVLGDSAVWAEPREDVEKLVPAYELLWGLVGVPRPPKRGWTVDGHKDAVSTVWRYTRGADTTRYITWRADGVENLQTYVVVDGKPVGKVTATFDAAHHVTKAQLISIANPARLDIVFDRFPAMPALKFEPEMWIAPHN